MVILHVVEKVELCYCRRRDHVYQCSGLPVRVKKMFSCRFGDNIMEQSRGQRHSDRGSKI